MRNIFYTNIYLRCHDFARVYRTIAEKASNEFVLYFCQSQPALLLVIKISMPLFRYFERRNALPDPKGSLSSKLCTDAIAQANKEVEVGGEQRGS